MFHSQHLPQRQRNKFSFTIKIFVFALMFFAISFFANDANAADTNFGNPGTDFSGGGCPEPIDNNTYSLCSGYTAVGTSYNNSTGIGNVAILNYVSIANRTDRAKKAGVRAKFKTTTPIITKADGTAANCGSATVTDTNWVTNTVSSGPNGGYYSPGNAFSLMQQKQGGNVQFSSAGCASGTTYKVTAYAEYQVSFNDGTWGESTNLTISVTFTIRYWQLNPQNWIWNGSDWVQNEITADPGQTVFWFHRVGETGSVNTATFNWGYKSSNKATGTENKNQTLTAYGTADWSQSSLTIPTSAEPNDLYCRYTFAKPGSEISSGEVSSATYCAKVRYNYTLTPRVTAGSTAVNAGDPVSFQTFVDNSGLTKSNNTCVRVGYFTLPSGATVPSATINDTYNLANVGANWPALTVWKDYGCAQTFAKTSTTEYKSTGQNSGNAWNTANFPSQLRTDNLQAGDRICMWIMVSPYRSADAKYRFSAPACTEVMKTTQLQIRGADSFAQTGFTGSTAPQAVRGSFSQYGLLTGSGGGITSFGSAGWTANSTASQTCKLMFANTPSGGGTNCTSIANAGNFGATRQTQPTLNPTTEVTKFSSSSCRIGVSCTGLWNVASGKYKATGNLEIWNSTGGSAATNGVNKNIEIVVSGNLYITDNIYSDFLSYKYKNVAEMPRLTIIANNIYVASGVNYLYGTFIAKNAFYSCAVFSGSTVSVPASTDAKLGQGRDCSNQLRIDGAVYSAKTPRFQRTFGGETSDPSAPAEIINYTPNLFLTPYIDDTESDYSSWKVDNMVELPARY